MRESFLLIIMSVNIQTISCLLISSTPMDTSTREDVKLDNKLLSFFFFQTSSVYIQSKDDICAWMLAELLYFYCYDVDRKKKEERKEKRKRRKKKKYHGRLSGHTEYIPLMP